MPVNEIDSSEQSHILFEIAKNISPEMAHEVSLKLQLYKDSIESLFTIEEYEFEEFVTLMDADIPKFGYSEFKTHKKNDLGKVYHFDRAFRLIAHNDNILKLIKDWFLCVINDISTTVNKTNIDDWKLMWRFTPFLDRIYDYEASGYYYTIESRIILWQDKAEVLNEIK